MKKRLEINRKTLDASLPPMSKAYEDRAQHVLYCLTTHKEEQVVKKKISVALVLALTILLVAIAAVAATLIWENYAAQIKQTEQGVYANWQTQDKFDLIKALVEMGYVEESNETNRLLHSAPSEEEVHIIADQLLMELTEREVIDISLAEITYAVMGYFTSWTPEQRVWWQELMGYESGAVDTLVIPGPDDLPEEEAIRIAKDRLTEAYGFEQDYLSEKTEASADLYITNKRPDYRRWMVYFTEFREGSDYVERVYSVVVDNAGEVIADPDVDMYLPEDWIEMKKNLPGRPTTPLFQTIDELNERMGWMPLSSWPLEQKAEYSEVIAPLIRPIVESGDLTPLINGDGPDLSIIAPAMYTYGLPGEHDMKQEDALALAKQAIMETYGLDSEIIALYDDISIYFDITNPGVSLWKFLFNPMLIEKFPDGPDSEQAWLLYKIDINARTGAVTKAEEFRFEFIGHDLEYDLKLY